MRILLLLVTLMATHSLFAQTQATKPLPIDDPEVKTFVDVARQVGLSDLFTGTGPFTIFAPSNAAVDKFSKWQTLQKPKNHDALVDLMIYHVIPGRYMSETLKTMDVQTINGKSLHITVESGQIKVNNAKVIRADMVGPNAVWYIIDTVLEP